MELAAVNVISGSLFFLSLVQHCCIGGHDEMVLSRRFVLVVAFSHSFWIEFLRSLMVMTTTTRGGVLKCT